jgi:hypothetical protein
MVAQLWERHDALDKATLELGKGGKEAEAEAHYMAAGFVFKQIDRLEQLGTVTLPRTLFDAAGHLLLIHGAIYSAAVNQTADSEGKILALLESSVWSLALLAREAGFDLPNVGRAHLTNTEMLIARGEVPA